MKTFNANIAADFLSQPLLNWMRAPMNSNVRFFDYFNKNVEASKILNSLFVD